MEHPTWKIGNGESLSLDGPRILGILNVTPDSFSDGGRHAAPDDALRHADRLIEEGADVIDIGGESTRPGAQPVDAREELARVLPVIRALRRRHPAVPLSIDTVKREVAAAALDEAVAIAKDASGFRLDAGLAHICAAQGAGVVLMHSRGSVQDMASFTHATYEDVVNEVVNELEESVRVAREGGVRPAHIVLDPGIGFAKRAEHS